jgi:hypothetical protein
MKPAKYVNVAKTLDPLLLRLLAGRRDSTTNPD